MNCSEAQEAISARIDRQLPEAEVRRLDAHLADCPACAAESRLQEALWRALDQAGPAPEPAADFLARVRARMLGPAVAGAPPRLAWLRRARVWTAALAAAAALLLAVAVPRFSTQEGGGGAGDALVEPTAEELEIAENLDLIEDLDLLAHLDALTTGAPLEEVPELLEEGEEMIR